jgi:hypothetical protein
MKDQERVKGGSHNLNAGLRVAKAWIQSLRRQKSVALFVTVFCSRLQDTGIERVVAGTVFP